MTSVEGRKAATVLPFELPQPGSSVNSFLGLFANIKLDKLYLLLNKNQNIKRRPIPRLFSAKTRRNCYNNNRRFWLDSNQRSLHRSATFAEANLNNYKKMGWSPGYVRRLMFRRSWVQIQAPYTVWTFLTFICCKNCIVWLNRRKQNEKEARNGRFKKFLGQWTFYSIVPTLQLNSNVMPFSETTTDGIATSVTRFGKISPVWRKF